ncbi:hypothetical protein AA313_de0204212 [Arthrobotrys entomopaga]|nr:hypothetical protein AA313_de0204212 [Arthrobotrys entomopaga]
MEPATMFPRLGFVFVTLVSTAHAWNYLFTGVGYNGPDQFENFISVDDPNDYTCYPAGLDMSLPKPDHLYIEVPDGESKAPKYMGLFGRPFREISKLQDKYSHLNDPNYDGCQDDNLFAIVAWFQGFPNLQELHFPFYNNQLSHIRAIDIKDPNSKYIANLENRFKLSQGDVLSKNIINVNNGDWRLEEGKIDLMPLGVYPPRYRGGDNWVPSPDVIRAEDAFLLEGRGPSGYITDVEYKRGQNQVRNIYNDYNSPSPAYTRLKFGNGEGAAPVNNMEGDDVIDEDDDDEEGSPVELNFNLAEPQIRPAPRGYMEEEMEQNISQEQEDIRESEMEEKEQEPEVRYSNREIMEMINSGAISNLSPRTKERVYRQYDEHMREFRDELEEMLRIEAEENGEQIQSDQYIYRPNGPDGDYN